MAWQLACAALLLCLCVIVHAGGTLAVIRLVRRHHVEPRVHAIHRPVGALVVGFLCVFALHMIEVAIWAGAYLGLGAFNELEEALYFSITCFTTLGFGDVVIGKPWRLLGASEGMIGLVLLGWSAGLFLVLLEPLNRRVLGVAERSA